MTRHSHGKGAKRLVWSRRDFLRWTTGAAIAVLLPGCQRSPPSLPAPVPSGWADTQPYKKSPPWRIGRSGRGDINAWMVMFSAHIEYGIMEKHRAQFKSYFCRSANWDPNKQVEDIRILLAEGIDLLLMDPMDTSVVATGAREAMDAGVPVVLAAGGLSSAPYVSWVATGEEERGASAAEWLGRTVGGGRVAVITAIRGAGDQQRWLEGVRHQLDGRSEAESIIARCPWSSEGAREAMRALLDQYAAIDGVVVHNGLLGRGVVAAFVERGEESPPIAGVDDWNGWLRTAREHRVHFFGLSGGANLGLRAVDLATDILSGVQVPRYVPFPYEVFDDSALDRYYRPDLSDHYWAIHDLPEAWIERMFRPS